MLSPASASVGACCKRASARSRPRSETRAFIVGLGRCTLLRRRREPREEDKRRRAEKKTREEDKRRRQGKKTREEDKRRRQEKKTREEQGAARSDQATTASTPFLEFALHGATLRCHCQGLAFLDYLHPARISNIFEFAPPGAFTLNHPEHFFSFLIT